MSDILGCCGLDCGGCPAHVATQKNDKNLIEETARKWSKDFGIEVSPKDVWCDGCTEPGTRKCAHCGECEIRACCMKRDIKNCGLCADYGCDRIKKFVDGVPDAKSNLEKVRKNKEKK